MKLLKSKPPDGEGMRERVDDALRKHELGEPLNQKELTIVQWVKYGGGCAACSGVEVAINLRAPNAPISTLLFDPVRLSC